MCRKNSVCFYTLSAYPLFNAHAIKVFGGAEVDLFLIATEIVSDHRFNVSFVLGDFGQDPIETRKGVTLLRSADPESNLILNAGKIWRALKRADADIYVTEAASLGTPLLAAFCKLHGRHFIYRTASAIETDGTYFRADPLRGRAFYWSLRQADAVISQNESDQVNLRSNVGIESVVIRNADRLPEAIDQPRETILWVGRSAPVKRPELFIKLARDLPQYKFTMICQRASGDTSYDALVDEARKLTNLDFIERVPFEEIDRYYLQAKILVNTSDFEGFPNTFVQACKCAVPILSLNVNPDGFLTTIGAGLCANGSWGSFVDMLHRLSDPVEHVSFSRNARIYAQENHDIKRIIEEYKKLFIRVAGAGEGSRLSGRGYF